MLDHLLFYLSGRYYILSVKDTEKNGKTKTNNVGSVDKIQRLVKIKNLKTICH